MVLTQSTLLLGRVVGIAYIHLFAVAWSPIRILDVWYRGEFGDARSHSWAHKATELAGGGLFYNRWRANSGLGVMQLQSAVLIVLALAHPITGWCLVSNVR